MGFIILSPKSHLETGFHIFKEEGRGYQKRARSQPLKVLRGYRASNRGSKKHQSIGLPRKQKIAVNKF